MVDQPEDKLSLAPGITAVHKALHIIAPHQRFQDTELLFCRCRHPVLPTLRQDGEVAAAPLLIAVVIDLRLRKLDQMTDTPAHQITAALQIAVTAF